MPVPLGIERWRINPIPVKQKARRTHHAPTHEL